MFQRTLSENLVSDRADFDNQISHEPGVVMGHEMGHGMDKNHDEGKGGNNVEKNENPIRKGMGEEPRKKYDQAPFKQEKKE